jgi:hypothetical protein
VVISATVGNTSASGEFGTAVGWADADAVGDGGWLGLVCADGDVLAPPHPTASPRMAVETEATING